MKRILAGCLTLVMMFSLCVPTLATDSIHNRGYYEEFEYEDVLGDLYHVIYTYDEKKAVVTVLDDDGNLISEAEREKGSNYIIETKLQKEVKGTPASLNGEKSTQIIDISELVLPVVEQMDNPVAPAVNTSVSINLPGSTTYTSKGMYNTDYIYQGNILKGEAFYRQTGAVDEYDRISYRFVRNTTINAIVLVLGGVYGWVTGTAIRHILGSAGIGIIGVGITTDWVFRGCVKAYEYQFKCEMRYNGSTKVMSVIKRDLEYLIVEDEDGSVIDFFFDDISYSSPSQAINMRCSEAVGYAAAAFNAKYITGSNPSLTLPVSGPVY